MKDLEARLRSAIRDSELADCGEFGAHGVVISQADAKRLLYRLIKEKESAHQLVYRRDHGK